MFLKNKNKIEQAYSEIGKKAYEKRTMDEEVMTFISVKIEEIDKLLKENEELRQTVELKNKLDGLFK